MKNIKTIRLIYLILAIVTGFTGLFASSILLLLICGFSIYQYLKYSKQLKDDSSVPSSVPIEKSSPVPPTPKYKVYDEYYSIYGQDENVINEFFKYHKEELEENEEYRWSSKELKEELNYDEKQFKYAPYEDCKFYIKDNEVFVDVDMENNYKKLGELKQSDVQKINLANDKKLVFYQGDYKYLEWEDDKIIKAKMDSYFKLVCEIKKEVH